jgi:hypothetical protein
MSGQVWYPKLAIGQNGNNLHIAWEQQAKSGLIENRAIWYIHGTWGATGVQWDSPLRASPTNQNAIRPDIAVDQAQQIHITWSEVVRGGGGFTNPEAQYITYQRGTPGQGNTPYRLHNRALMVNDTSPTVTEPSIHIHGERLCITWHGFFEGNNKEEIWMQCSSDSGRSWQKKINISQSPDLFSIFPHVHIDSQDQAHLIWGEFSLEGSELQPESLYYRTGGAYLAQVFLPVTLREQ